MLTGMTPSTHDGRRNDLAPGVDGGELTGEMVMRRGAEPLSCDDPANPSSTHTLVVVLVVVVAAAAVVVDAANPSSTHL